MKHSIFIVFFNIITSLSFSQKKDIWVSFFNKDSTLVGFKDSKSEIKIEPKFTGFTIASKFDDVLVVSESINDHWQSYYLNKSGKKFGLDSLFIFDNRTDCESEGFIRFSDYMTNNIGMFNKNGEVVIPANYNALTAVRNGLVIALKNAKKDYWHKDDHDGCDHFSWIGGQTILIDTLNNILVDNFTYEKPLNLFSVEKSKRPLSSAIRTSFLGTNGTYYSFVDFEKEFEEWFKKDFLSNISEKKLLLNSFNKIVWSSKRDWESCEKNQFINDNFLLLKEMFSEILTDDCNYDISQAELNSFIFEGADFDEYFDNCRDAKWWIYPTMNVYIINKKDKGSIERGYEFLRTNQGYKLISIRFSDTDLKRIK
ncbi:WG repeat-containing protein [Paenimyroides aestuarii]|uniref:WG repeat-containing protein n=1 Tax=Paenimyroides aestuarii TaxID=2968490 RepID=A0ABY5NTD2_9FLAO|nr:WG repeat-containing protein [Paenimyroides aestuarii]UUV21657.1 hypothetical protein NPX36_00995 [Paenimyroides aestuarii]